MQKTANALKYLSMLGFVHVLFKFKYINLKSFKNIITEAEESKCKNTYWHTCGRTGENGEKALH